MESMIRRIFKERSALAGRAGDFCRHNHLGRLWREVQAGHEYSIGPGPRSWPFEGGDADLASDRDKSAMGASKKISDHIDASALISAVGTPERPRQHDRHQQSAGSQNEHIGDATDVELSDVADKKIRDHPIERTPQHIHHGRRSSLAGWGSEWRRERAAGHAVDEMRDGIDEESAAEKVGDEEIPVHGSLPSSGFGKAETERWRHDSTWLHLDGVSPMWLAAPRIRSRSKIWEASLRVRR